MTEEIEVGDKVEYIGPQISFINLYKEKTGLDYLIITSVDTNKVAYYFSHPKWEKGDECFAGGREHLRHYYTENSILPQTFPPGGLCIGNKKETT